MLHRLWSSLILFALFASTAVAKEFEQHVIVVLDDTGIAQSFDMTAATDGTRDLPSLRLARLALIEKLEDDYGREDLITVVSMAIPQVIWSGGANALKRRDNYALGDFLKSTFGGCSNLDTVLSTVRREAKRADLPVAELIVMSSLLHTGGSTRNPTNCVKPDTNNMEPHASFMSGLKDFHFRNEKAPITLYWVFDEIDDAVFDYLDRNAIDFKLYGERETIGQLLQ